jgi:phosphomannomutase
MPNLDAIVKAYDVRGTVPDQFDESLARAFGVAFVQFTKASSVVVAHDMRPSGPGLVAAFQDGVTSCGASVVNLGLASTDLLYYASGIMNLPGAMFTASHNPAQYNGIKMCSAGARSIGIDNGLADIRELARAALATAVVGDATKVTKRNMLSDFADHVLSFIEVSSLRPMKVVADTANGMGGLVVPAVFDRLDMIDMEIMYGELDGTFPNHPADPIQPANQRDLQARVSTSVWRSTAMPIACSWWTSLVAPCRAAPRRRSWPRCSCVVIPVRRSSTTSSRPAPSARSSPRTVARECAPRTVTAT